MLTRRKKTGGTEDTFWTVSLLKKGFHTTMKKRPTKVLTKEKETEINILHANSTKTVSTETQIAKTSRK